MQQVSLFAIQLAPESKTMHIYQPRQGFFPLGFLSHPKSSLGNMQGDYINHYKKILPKTSNEKQNGLWPWPIANHLN
jgi:hypothetical protein